MLAKEEQAKVLRTEAMPLCTATSGTWLDPPESGDPFGDLIAKPNQGQKEANCGQNVEGRHLQEMGRRGGDNLDAADKRTMKRWTQTTVCKNRITTTTMSTTRRMVSHEDTTTTTTRTTKETRDSQQKTANRR